MNSSADASGGLRVRTPCEIGRAWSGITGAAAEESHLPFLWCWKGRRYELRHDRIGGDTTAPLQRRSCNLFIWASRSTGYGEGVERGHRSKRAAQLRTSEVSLLA